MSDEAVGEPVEPSDQGGQAMPAHPPAWPPAPGGAVTRPESGGETATPPARPDVPSVRPDVPAARAGVPEAVVPAGPPPEPTGEPRVDLVLRRFAELDGTPVSRHVAVFQDVHQRLQDLLTAADEPEDAGPEGAGPEGAGPPVPRPPMPRPPGPGVVPPRGGAAAPGGRP